MKPRGTKFRRFLKRLTSPEKSFARINQVPLLIIDSAGADAVEKLIPLDTPHSIFYARNELLHLNLRTILWTFIYLFRGVPAWSAYVSAVVKQVDPAIAVTFIDNAPYFHEIASLFPATHFVAVQNGTRFPTLSKGQSLPPHRNYASVFFSFGDHEITSYEMQGTCFRETKALGSLRSSINWSEEHARKENDQKADFDICFVSTSVSVRDGIWFYENDLLAKWLREFLLIHPALVVVVAMRSGPHDHLEHLFERNFYQNIFGDGVILSPRLQAGDTYFTMDNSEVTISSGSSISYEGLGRGNRSLICHPSHVAEEVLGQFKVPAPFILQTLNREDFFQKLDELLEMSNSSFRTKYRNSTDYFCQPVSKDRMSIALSAYFQS